VENCGKLWRLGREAQGEVYSIDGVGGKNEMRACSACAGDYEDPDRTARTADDVEDEERDGAPRETTEEFPAEDR